MNEHERLENEINETMELLDRFDHPAVPDDLARQISRRMAGEYRHGRVRRILFRVGTPLAAAAAVAIVGLLMLSGTFRSTPPQSPVTPTIQISAETDRLIAEWVEQEQNAYGLFDDLNFQITRSAASQPATSSAEEEWDALFLEALELCSSI